MSANKYFYLREYLCNSINLFPHSLTFPLTVSHHKRPSLPQALSVPHHAAVLPDLFSTWSDSLSSGTEPPTFSRGRCGICLYGLNHSSSRLRRKRPPWISSGPPYTGRFLCFSVVLCFKTFKCKFWFCGKLVKLCMYNSIIFFWLTEVDFIRTLLGRVR